MPPLAERAPGNNPNRETEMTDTTTTTTTPSPADVAAKAATATEPNGNGGTNGTPVRLPDDHPLVKAYNAEKAENQAKTAKIAEYEQAQMTEAEKAEARVKAAEQRAVDLEAANARKDVAIEYGLSAEDVALLEGVSDVEAMKRLAGRLAQHARDQSAPRPPKPNPAQRTGDAPTEDKDAIARQFFGI